MRILLVSEFFPTGKNLKFSGGVEARTFFVAKILAKNHQVFVLTSRIPGSKKEEKMHRFTVVRVGPVRSYSATTGSIIERLMFIKSAIFFSRLPKVDLIDSTNFVTHFIAALISRKNNTPSVAWYPDVWIGSWIKITGLHGVLGELLERLNLFLKSEAYIAISKETAKKLKEHVNQKIYIIPCGVDKKEIAARAKKFEKDTIICISRLTKYKNIRTLILAFAHLQTRLKDVRMLIIGTGPEYKNLKKLSKSLNINNKVKFISNIPRRQLVQNIKSSHIFCLPSIVEGFGIATIEATAAGLPYVNSNTAVQREITHNGMGGFLTDPQNPLEFSKKFYSLLTNKKLYSRKCQEALSLSKYYSWEEVSKQTEAVYKDLLSMNTRGS